MRVDEIALGAWLVVIVIEQVATVEVSEPSAATHVNESVPI